MIVLNFGPPLDPEMVAEWLQLALDRQEAVTVVNVPQRELKGENPLRQVAALLREGLVRAAYAANLAPRVLRIWEITAVRPPQDPEQAFLLAHVIRNASGSLFPHLIIVRDGHVSLIINKRIFNTGLG